MIDRIKAIERCQNCENADLSAFYDGCPYTGCKLSENRWIATVEICPKEKDTKNK